MVGLIRVAVVDDHPATAEGLASLLASSDGIEVVGTARDIRGARDLIRAATPDVVLCDIELGAGARGFELLATQRPGEGTIPAVVFFSAYDYPAFRALARARLAGAGSPAVRADAERFLAVAPYDPRADMARRLLVPVSSGAP